MSIAPVLGGVVARKSCCVVAPKAGAAVVKEPGITVCADQVPSNVAYQDLRVPTADMPAHARYTTSLNVVSAGAPLLNPCGTSDAPAQYPSRPAHNPPSREPNECFMADTPVDSV